eukprot:752560-Hanusia_phi.AAC.3
MFLQVAAGAKDGEAKELLPLSCVQGPSSCNVTMTILESPEGLEIAAVDKDAVLRLSTRDPAAGEGEGRRRKRGRGEGAGGRRGEGGNMRRGRWGRREECISEHPDRNNPRLQPPDSSPPTTWRHQCIPLAVGLLLSSCSRLRCKRRERRRRTWTMIVFFLNKSPLTSHPSPTRREVTSNTQ